MIKIKVLSNNEDVNFQKDLIYITFSKITYLKYKENLQLIYFFNISHEVCETEVSESLEKNLFLESKDNSKDLRM